MPKVVGSGDGSGLFGNKVACSDVLLNIVVQSDDAGLVGNKVALPSVLLNVVVHEGGAGLGGDRVAGEEPVIMLSDLSEASSTDP